MKGLLRRRKSYHLLQKACCVAHQYGTKSLGTKDKASSLTLTIFHNALELRIEAYDMRHNSTCSYLSPNRTSPSFEVVVSCAVVLSDVSCCQKHRRAVIPAPEAIFREVPVSRERSQNISDELLQYRPAILRSITRAGSDRNRIKNQEDKIISSPPAKDNITSTEYTVSIFLLKRTAEGLRVNTKEVLPEAFSSFEDDRR
ncbi:unnamed protein product [Leuciscus chuanchicus]